MGALKHDANGCDVRPWRVQSRSGARLALQVSDLCSWYCSTSLYGDIAAGTSLAASGQNGLGFQSIHMGAVHTWH
jgi:hypothetical protein